MTGQHVRAATAPGNVTQRSAPAAIRNGLTTRALEADLFGRYLDGIGRAFRRQAAGMTPYEWGISRACAKMRRQNRLRALGVRGSRI